MSESKKRMGGMSLSSFGKATPIESVNDPTNSKPLNEKKPAKKAKPKKMATLNIQVGRDQQRWLQDTALAIRDNNTEPVAGPDRVYPVHLIQAAIDLLKNSDIDWAEVRDVSSLKDVIKGLDH